MCFNINIQTNILLYIEVHQLLYKIQRILKRFVEKEDSNKIVLIINPRLLPKFPPKLRLPLFVQLATPSSASLTSMRTTMRDRNTASVYLHLGSFDNNLSDDAIMQYRLNCSKIVFYFDSYFHTKAGWWPFCAETCSLPFFFFQIITVNLDIIEALFIHQRKQQ